MDNCTTIKPEEHLPLAYAVATKYCAQFIHCDADRQDAKQEAAYAVVCAAKTFNPLHERADWKQYVLWNIKRKLCQWIRKRAMVPKCKAAPTRKREGMDTPEVILKMIQQKDPEEGMFVQELRVALSRLKESQRRVIACYFGLEGYEKRTQKELADAEGVSKQAIEQRLRGGVSRLKKFFGAKAPLRRSTVKTTLSELKKLIGKFEKTANKYRRFGATDTEPDGVFQWLLVQAVKGKKPTVPTTVDGWELYSDMVGNGAAAANLGRSARTCVEFIGSIPVAHVGEVQEYLRSYCWRVSW